MAVHLCVGALLIRDDAGTKVLLAHRSPTRAIFPDVWDFPGGHREPGETLEQTLARELREEIGVTPVAWSPLGELATAAAGDEEGIVLHAFAVTAWRGDPTNRLPEEHTAIGWFDIEDACRLVAGEPDYVRWLRGLSTRNAGAKGSPNPPRG
jgi:8-oxo-dGTP diphosphatase